MRSSYIVIAVVVPYGRLRATKLEISSIPSTTVTRWENRNVSELITAIGPFDTTSIQGELEVILLESIRQLPVTARTTREDKIVKIDVQGTNQVCSAYLAEDGQRMATRRMTQIPKRLILGRNP